jgi:phenylacetate-CoA ligase
MAFHFETIIMMYQQFLQRILLPIGDLINNSSFCKDLSFWRKVDALSSEELAELQQNNLKKILQHTSSNVKYYSSVKLTGDKPNKWLQEFPILTKDILRSNSEELLAVKNKGLKKISSSGSSGISSSVYMNNKDLSSLRAGLIHWWEWYGYRIGNPIIQTGISPNRGLLKSLKDYFFKTIYINAFSHSEEQIIKILKRVKKSNHYVLAGYASSLNVMAEVAEKHRFKIRFKSVISFGDKMFSHYRKNIEKVFSCTVYDTYGSAEGFLIGAEYDLEYMYILSPQVYIEILDDNNEPVPDGTIGNVVVTRLDGYAMPLIRYKIGDLGVLLPKNKYPKERKYQYPLLQQIVGRDTDIVKTKGGKILVVHSFTGIFEYVSEIKQFKIIQRNLDGISIQYIKSNGFTNSILTDIIRKLQFYIEDETFIITFIEVKFIAPTKSGKPQIIESLI